MTFDRRFATGPAVGRRDALLGASAAAVLTAAGCGPLAAQGPQLTPEMFGARGDGRTDDYPALLRLAEAANAAGGGAIRFGRGRRYSIGRHIVGGPSPNNVAHITLRNCRGLHIDLNGSAISVKGDFHRRADRRDERGHQRAFAHGVIPLQFWRCVDVSLRNGELDGNVQRMTRDRGVVEIGGGHAVEMLGCERVLFEGLHIHHFSVDGIRLGITAPGEEFPCRDVRLNQVRLTNNGRQGLTIAGATGVVATDSSFSETGVTGAYGWHAPAAGVDVEPFRDSPVLSDFRALRCRFDGNVGSPVVAGNPQRTSLVELIDCGGRVPTLRRLILTSARAIVRGGAWHNVQIACAYAARRHIRAPISIDVSGAQWSGDHPGWSPVYDVNPRQPHVYIHNNRFQLVPTAPFTASYAFLCANPNHRFEENEIFVSRAAHDGAGVDFVGQFRGAAAVRRNRWSTDARAPLRFANNYTGVQRLEGESFTGSFGPFTR